MKVIDLLNKLVKDEEVPKTIQLFTYIYKYCEDIKDYKVEDSEYYCLIKDFIKSCDDLNEEVKIIEDTPEFKGFKVKDEEIIYKEDKKIEYIEPSETMFENHIIIMKKINEIIDHLNVEK